MTARARTPALVALAAAALLAGCGGGKGDSGAGSASGGAARTQPSPPPGDTRRADPAAVRTIRGWVNNERLSRAGRAATYFSLPAIVLNGNDPLLLRTRTDVRAWNVALPCGAALLRAVDVRGWTVVRFRLTDRSGGHCDSPGGSASTAFALRKGKIAMWIRVRDDVSPQMAAPPRPPDRDFLRHGLVRGRPVPGEDSPLAAPAA
jgi:hypothetical protein